MKAPQVREADDAVPRLPDAVVVPHDVVSGGKEVACVCAEAHPPADVIGDRLPYRRQLLEGASEYGPGASRGLDEDHRAVDRLQGACVGARVARDAAGPTVHEVPGMRYHKRDAEIPTSGEFGRETPDRALAQRALGRREVDQIRVV